MKQTPAPDSSILRWRGDELAVTLELSAPEAGRAVFRTNLGAAAVSRREIIALTERDETPLEAAWRDVPMAETAPGSWSCTVPLGEVGVFAGKCCFFPSDGSSPRWPDGGNLRIKVEPAETRRRNAIYTVFPRQFGSFRAVAGELDFIIGEMGFDIIQTLPVFPVPVTYAVMGEYGCPFAATDFFSVDPAMAEFDERATPLDQFRELIAAVHARGGRLFVDLPANHTGWASTLQTHHPDWFRRATDGRFISPGAWGVTWSDLVALDYSHPELRAYMAEVFLFWVRNGVDGFRCDAGYMIPAETWSYIVARVREEYPDTVFMLEGLGGELSVTDRLLSESGLDWAYSEIFQTYDRAAFESYLPGAIDRARRFGALVHFAETHDNDRLAKGGIPWARLRVALAALLSHQGAWGIANGVEWYATEKIDVHGKNDLNWGAHENMVPLIARLNRLISSHPDFTGNDSIELVTRGGGNVLAVRRGGTLLLFNLDCGCGTGVHWDDSAFPAVSEPYNLLTGAKECVAEGYWLDPGAFRVFSHRPMPSAVPPGKDCPIAATDLPTVSWTYPADLHRTVCVPDGCALAVTAPHAFRVRVNAGERTVAVSRGVAGGKVPLELPGYAGDGTRGEARELVITVYAPEGVRRASAKILQLPPAEKARAKLVYTGHEVRCDSALETVLSNAAGAAGRVKLAWGEIASQYDALFAANTNPAVPADRLVLWTRCRAWLQHEGYSRELNRDVIDSCRVDPAGRFAEWIFRIPCGLGRTVRFSFTLSLATDANAARLSVRRLTPPDGAEEPARVRIVFRPDLEWRSFHATTKAQGAVERAFAQPSAAVATKDGFRFAPYAEDEILDFSVSGGECHLEGEWTYSVPHPEESARGQDGSGDLFSPAWIACDFAPGSESALTAAYRPGKTRPRFPEVPLEGPTALPLADALAEALKLFIVRRDDVKTVIAGYPWFLDWGRDTFIFLQGAIAAGYRREALEIVEAFARFEDRGTLPNIIYGDTAGNRDTTDAPLWFVRTLAALGGEADRFRPVAESIVSHYVSGTPNGIRMDAESGLVWSPAHFTWMDTNYPACTPREGYPVEIQALWISALRYLGGARWNALADKAADSLARLFALPEGGLADCLDAPAGTPAAAARADAAVRPNQLFALTLGVLPEGVASSLAEGILRATSALLIPGSMRSLRTDDARYRGVYAGDEDTSRKPAYHNGTAWGWVFPLHAEAWVRYGGASPEVARSLLAGAVELLNAGCACQLPEIADGDAPHAQKGCRAQAWSVSELLRVWLSAK